jgi:hypothetical protein
MRCGNWQRQAAVGLGGLFLPLFNIQRALAQFRAPRSGFINNTRGTVLDPHTCSSARASAAVHDCIPSIAWVCK